MALIRDLISTGTPQRQAPKRPRRSTRSSAAPAPAPTPAPAARRPPRCPRPHPCAGPGTHHQRRRNRPGSGSRHPAAKPAEARPHEGEGRIGRGRQALSGWAAAWSNKDVAAYLARYAPEFNPPGHVAQAWEAEREDRIAGKSGKISGDLTTSRIFRSAATSDDQIPVQHYKATGLKTSTSKVVVFVRAGGKMAHSGRKSPVDCRSGACPAAAWALPGRRGQNHAKAAPAPASQDAPGKISSGSYHPPTAARLAPAESIPRMPTVTVPVRNAAARIFRRNSKHRLDEALRLTENLVGQFPQLPARPPDQGRPASSGAQPHCRFRCLTCPGESKVADLRRKPSMPARKGYKEKPAANFLPRYLLQMPPDQHYAIGGRTPRNRGSA